MTKELNEEIKAHLEFLGYTIKDIGCESGFLFIASSNNKRSLMVRVLNNMTILTIRCGGVQSKAIKSKDFFEIINTINTNVMTKWYYELDEEGEDEIAIKVEADYYDYNKATFGNFVSNFEAEANANMVLFSKFSKE